MYLCIAVGIESTWNPVLPEQAMAPKRMVIPFTEKQASESRRNIVLRFLNMWLLHCQQSEGRRWVLNRARSWSRCSVLTTTAGCGAALNAQINFLEGSAINAKEVSSSSNISAKCTR